MAQHSVSGGMAPGVVDALEVVQVQTQQPALQRGLASDAVELQRQPRHEAAPIGRTRQKVRGGLALDLAGQQFALGDVLEGGIDLVQPAVFKQGHGIDQDPDV